MVDLVEGFEADVAHGVGLLGDGGFDGSVLDKVEGVGVGVHGDDGAVGGVGTLEDFGDLDGGGGFEADEGVDFIGAGFGDVALGGVEGVVGVTLDIDYVDDFDSGVAGDFSFIALEALFEIGLAGVGEEDDVAFAVELFDESFTTEAAGGDVVGSDEVEAGAGGSVGIDGEDGDSGGDGGVDVFAEEGGVGDGDEDAGGVAGDGVAEGGEFGAGVEFVGAVFEGGDVIVGGGSFKAGADGLPVGELEVVGYEDVGLRLGVGLAAGDGEEESDGEEGKRRFEIVHGRHP